MGKVQLSFSDVEKISALNAELRIAANNAILKLRTIPREKRNSFIENQIQYWKNVRSALKWATGQARQRMKGVSNV